jgi:[acyl-carrier-protein] S-malonyltransferase
MRVFLFPGQGSQEIGMGADLFRSDEAFRQLVSHASQCAGTDLEKLCLRGPDRELTRTEFLQPLLVAVSLGYLRRLTELGIEPDLVLGHSLGEITALAAAGALVFEDAVTVAADRGRLMAEAARRNAGGLMAVITSQRETVLTSLRDACQTGLISLANDNSPNQIVYAGTNAGLEEAARLVTQQQLGSCRRLPVSGPWHSPRMEDARRGFAEQFRLRPMAVPRVPIMMNVSAAAEKDPERIRSLVVRSLTEPVLWRSSMEGLKAMKPESLLEIGPGRVLSGLARANGCGDEIRVCSVNNLRGVELARKQIMVFTSPSQAG